MSQHAFEQLRHLTREAGYDAVAVVPGPNFRYLTGIDFHLLERPLVLFVPKDGDPVILIPYLELPKWDEAGIHANVFAWKDAEGYEQAFQSAIRALGMGAKIGVEGLRMRVLESFLIDEYGGGHVSLADEVFVDLRIIKSPEEIEQHRQAVHISEVALAKTVANLKLGMTERDIAKMIAHYHSEGGGQGEAFGALVLFGPRSALPHGIPGDTPLKKGDTLLIDFGTTYEGYVSDLTRTFFIGEPSDQAQALYEAVNAANEAGRVAVKPGVTAEDVDLAAAQKLKDAGFADYILHRTGHGIGTDVHEDPSISEGNQRKLAEGMVFTIEPGLYIDGEIGIRIEDNVVVTADGCESLSTYSRELTVLDVNE
jgi:Xaa-Pro dipeptidase